MTKINFDELIGRKNIVGKSFKNLSGNGTTKLLSCDNNKIRYKRGKTTFSLSIEELWAVYQKYFKEKVSSSDLRKYKPHIFSSNHKGHSCHCTTLFLIFKELNIVNNIFGKGVKGNPFYIKISQ